jgi:hypothetical protein
MLGSLIALHPSIRFAIKTPPHAVQALSITPSLAPKIIIMLEKGAA